MALDVETAAAVDQRFDEARRYSLMLHEDLKDDMRIVADGVAAIAAKLDTRP